MRRPPKRKASNTAQVRTNTSVTKGADGPFVHATGEVTPIVVPLPPGEETVSVGYDQKVWASDYSLGMTVGTSSHVKLSCRFMDLEEANDLAADLAWKYLEKNQKRSKQKLMSFLEKKDVNKD